jgi:deoxynucleotide monophosphate kinase-like protein
MIIGLTGRKGAGKDTVGQMLVEHYDFTRIAFADKLKEAVANLFGITVAEVEAMKTQPNAEVHLFLENEIFVPAKGDPNHTPYVAFPYRYFLQRFGTEMGRNTFGEDFWVKLWLEALPDKGDVVATDVRFENEIHAVRASGGKIIEIIRPGHEPDGHASEEPLDQYLIDEWIGNDGTIEELRAKVDFTIGGLINMSKAWVPPEEC